MTPDIHRLDLQLQKVYTDGVDDSFVEFCTQIVERYPVAFEILDIVNLYKRLTEDILILYSGYKAEILGKFAEQTTTIKCKEVELGNWRNAPEDATALAELMARRAYNTIMQVDQDVKNPDSVAMVLGLYIYATIYLNPKWKATDFRQMFVLAWSVYYSDIITALMADEAQEWESQLS
jgi:hypothetical protein